MDKQKLRSQRETILVAFVLFLGSLFILYPFLDAIVIAIVVSYMLRFAHKNLNERLDNEFLSSAIVVTSVILSIALIFYVFINNFFEILTQFNAFTGSLREGLLNLVEFLNLSDQFKRNLESFLNRVSERVTESLISTFTSLPSLLIDMAIFLVTALYIYKDREKLESQINGLIENIPYPERKIVKSLLRSIDEVFRGVFLTQFTVALILAVISALGFYLIAMMTSSIAFIPLWSLLIGVAALVPLFAAFMIYGPIGVYYIMVGEPLKGTLILLFGTVVINIVTEIFLRPYVGSKQMDEHPLVIFLGFLTGPLVLGVKGIIIGPLLLILTKEFALNYANTAYGGTEDGRNEDSDS